MNQNPHPHISSYTKPKRKTLKIVILVILVVLLGVGAWVGITAFNALKKITAFSSGNNSMMSLFGDSSQKTLKGQSDGRTNILLLGMGGKNHPGGLLTDSIMVMSIDWQTKKVALMSIPRDLYVQIPGYGYAKINEAYAYGAQNAKLTGGGGQVASETVSKVFGIPVHYFYTVDFEGFKKLVDNVGGIDVVVDKDLNDPLYPAADMINYDPFKITAGPHHLDGKVALKYARSRETTSDFDRSKRQQKVIAATKTKVMTLDILANPKKITDLMNIIGDHVQTNMSVEEIKTFWSSIKDLDLDNMINKVFDTAADGPLTSSTSSKGSYIIIPKKGQGNYAELQEIAQNIFVDAADTANGTVQGATINKSLKIEVLNASGSIGQAKKAADKLKIQGYTNVITGDAPTNRAETIAYSCKTNTTASTAKKIAEYFSTTYLTKSTCTSGVDISLVIGQNAVTR